MAVQVATWASRWTSRKTRFSPVTKNRRGQGSSLGGDLPVIIMIVVAIGFFLSSLGIALNQFQGAKGHINLKQGAVDASNTFMSENALIDEDSCQEGGFLKTKLKDIEVKYGVKTYVEVLLEEGNLGCQIGEKSPGAEPETAVIRTYPVAWEVTPLDVRPAVIKLTLWRT